MPERSRFDVSLRAHLSPATWPLWFWLCLCVAAGAAWFMDAPPEAASPASTGAPAASSARDPLPPSAPDEDAQPTRTPPTLDALCKGEIVVESIPGPVLMDMRPRRRPRRAVPPQQTVKISPYYSDDRLSGFRIMGMTATSPYRALGFKAGDVLLSINGAPVTRPQHAMFMEPEETLAKRITVLRRGRCVTLEVTLQQHP